MDEFIEAECVEIQPEWKTEEIKCYIKPLNIEIYTNERNMYLFKQICDFGLHK